MSPLLIVAVVAPLTLGAYFIPDLAEQNGAGAPVSSWPMLGGDPGRTFRLGMPGARPDFAYQPWSMQEGGLQSESGSWFFGALTGDVNGDGTEELVVASMPFEFFENATGKLSVWSPDGSLRWSINLSTPSGPPVLLDWDSDGRMDIHVANGALNQIWSGSGELLWNMPLPAPLPCGVHCADSLGVDLTGDGLLDVVADALPILGRHQSEVYAVDGRTGQLLWAYPMPCDGRPPPTAVRTDAGPRVLTVCPGLGVNSSEARDDQVLIAVDTKDVAVQGQALPWYDSVTAWKHDFTPKTPSDLGIRNVIAGDVDGDGIDEVVVSMESPRGVAVFESDGVLVASWATPVDRQPFSVHLAQLDDEPGLEIIEGTRDGHISAYDFRDGEVLEYWTSKLPLGNATVVAAADLDGDGVDEIVAPAQVGFWCEHEGNGVIYILGASGNIIWRSEPTRKCVQPVRGIALADVDKDGDIEIISPAMSELLVFGVGPQPRH